MAEKNPFSASSYLGEKYFCDREDETCTIINAAENGRSLVLTSLRRLGKTGLLRHTQGQLTKTKKWITIYLDILDTSSDEELTNRLITQSIQAIEKSNATFLHRTITLFARFNPKFSFDALTGTSSVELSFDNPQDLSMSLDVLFDTFADQKKNIQISIDEFQQIANYDQGSRIDVILRKHMQAKNNVHFIFSGSQSHLLADLFSNPKRPMFSMVQYLTLEAIPYPKYFDFIKEKFEEADKEIEDYAIHEILTWTKTHTYYTQFICNRLFSKNRKAIKLRDVQSMKLEIFQELEFLFINYKNILSRNQWKVLEAIALEDSLKSVRAQSFTKKYDIPPSTAQQSLEYLIEKELVIRKQTKSSTSFSVYDVFLSRWLAYK